MTQDSQIKKAKQRQLWKSIIKQFLACSFYAFSSISALVSLRSAYADLKIQQPTMLYNLTFMSLLQLYHWFAGQKSIFIKYGVAPPTFKSYKVGQKQMQYSSFIFVISILFSQYALTEVQLPLYSIIRRTSPLIVLSLALIIDREVPTLKLVIICTLFLVGAYITVLGEANFVFFPLFLIILNNLFAILHGRSLRSMKQFNKAPLEVNIANAINLSVMLFLIAVGTGQFAAFFNDPKIYSYKSVFLISIVSFFGVCISISEVICVLVNSTLATSITGCVKDPIMNVVVIIKNQQLPTPQLLIGNLTQIVAAILYSSQKIKEQQKSIEKPKDK